MNEKKTQLISSLAALLTEDERRAYGEIIDYLLGLGYVPRRQNVEGFVLSFQHSVNSKVIAKIGIRKGQQKGFVRVKFFACRNVPENYTNALRREIETTNEQYCGPLRSQTEKNKCGSCASCTGGGVGYYLKHPDGREILRCGAYPILLPDVTAEDIPQIKMLILEQHNYFLSIA